MDEGIKNQNEVPLPTHVCDMKSKKGEQIGNLPRLGSSRMSRSPNSMKSQR